MPREASYDIAIIGAGVLGVSLAFWLSSLYDCSICVIEMEEGVGLATTTRNTGVLHRPFYIDPNKKRVFARSAQKSYPLWRKLALQSGAEWSQVGTLEVASTPNDVATLDRYGKWALENGMQEGEAEVLDTAGVRNIEPEVRCFGAIHSKTDTGVYFGELTRGLFSFAEKNGVRLLSGFRVVSVEENRGGTEILVEDKLGGSTKVSCRLAINVAGGASLDIAHMLSLAGEYTDLHFRGEYWLLDGAFALTIKRNVYTVPRHKEFPFLDPHFVVRADGTREIGPNAVLVAGPYTYAGLGNGVGEVLGKVAERPLVPKIRLFTNPKFLSLVASEWRSSLSKRAMCERVSRFIPNLRLDSLNQRGISGVRSSLVSSAGFVPEAVEVHGQSSVHVLNFNSPGATGAPAYSAHMVERLQEEGYLGFKRKTRQDNADLWDYEWASNLELLLDPA